jgi:type II secretory ATPase GspE/PulE/Tfp pilus assembly ATPase PilB-like protein
MFRKAIAAGADQATLRKAAMQDGMKQLRDAGMALVIEGSTSLDELQRVFTAAASPPSGPPVAAAAKGKPRS